MPNNNLSITVNFDDSMKKDIREWISETHIEKQKVREIFEKFKQKWTYNLNHGGVDFEDLEEEFGLND